MKDEVDVLGSPSLIIRTLSVDAKQYVKKNRGSVGMDGLLDTFAMKVSKEWMDGWMDRYFFYFFIFNAQSAMAVISRQNTFRSNTMHAGI